MKNNFVMYRNEKKSAHKETETRTKQCETERLLRFTIITLAMQDPTMAGYLLTGKRNQFLKMEGSIAWLYECKNAISPLRIMENVCYDKIPIEIYGKLKFVDPISRQTFPFANEIACLHSEENIFSLDPDDPDQWIMMSPRPIKQNAPKYFPPRNEAFQSITDTQEFSENYFDNFWSKIVSTKMSEKILEQFTKSFLLPQGNDNNSLIAKNWQQINIDGHRTNIYLDQYISPTFIQGQFTSLFGWIIPIVTQLGGLYAFLMLTRLTFKMIQSVITTFEIHQMTGITFSFGKSILAGTFNIRYMSAIANMQNMQNMHTRNERINSYHDTTIDIDNELNDDSKETDYDIQRIQEQTQNIILEITNTQTNLESTITNRQLHTVQTMITKQVLIELQKKPEMLRTLMFPASRFDNQREMEHMQCDSPIIENDTIVPQPMYIYTPHASDTNISRKSESQSKVSL